MFSYSCDPTFGFILFAMLFWLIVFTGGSLKKEIKILGE